MDSDDDKQVLRTLSNNQNAESSSKDHILTSETSLFEEIENGVSEAKLAEYAPAYLEKLKMECQKQS